MNETVAKEGEPHNIEYQIGLMKQQLSSLDKAISELTSRLERVLRASKRPNDNEHIAKELPAVSNMAGDLMGLSRSVRLKSGCHY